MKNKRLPAILMLLSILFFFSANGFAQSGDFTAIRAGVYFDHTLRDWDGFGFNYVQTAHFIDKNMNPKESAEWWEKYHPGENSFVQEYGGFSILDEKEKAEIIDLVFGENGLKPGIVKMFLGADHQKEPGGSFDHESTAGYMREFVRDGLEVTRKRGDDLQVITTLYGPPGFMTKQKKERGRDLDPEFKDDLAIYMADWVKFLKEEDKLPVKYLSLNNEGEDWSRWNNKGYTDWYGHDFNLFWPPEQMTEFLKLMPKMLKTYGVKNVEVTNGELTNWYRFSYWGYADQIAMDREALKNLGLITSHGFYSGNYGVWFGEHTSYGNDVLREKKPDLHSWVTSTSWANMDAQFVKQIHGNIYTAKVNAIVPWAGIQRPTHWVGGDPNPGSAIRVHEDGSYEILKGYYFYKQVSRAGQHGMKVAKTFAMQSEIAVIGFSSNGTKNPDSFIVINISREKKPVEVEIHGSAYKVFEAFRTVDNENYESERYKSLGTFQVENGRLYVETLPGSVTTFFGKN